MCRCDEHRSGDFVSKFFKCVRSSLVQEVPCRGGVDGAIPLLENPLEMIVVDALLTTASMTLLKAVA